MNELKRTKGVWGVAENHVEDNNFNYTILSNMSKIVCEVMRHNFLKVGKSKFKNFTTLFPDQEAKSNAEFICKAVNEYDKLKGDNTKLLEALEKARDILSNNNLMDSLSGFYIQEVIDKAKK